MTNLGDITQCQRCHAPYTEPRMLQCEHSLCEACCTALFDQANCSLTCPQCGETTQIPSVSSLCINVELAALIKQLGSFCAKQSRLKRSSILGSQVQQPVDAPAFMDLGRGQLLSAAEGLARAARGEQIRTLPEAAEVLRPRVALLVKQLQQKEQRLRETDALNTAILNALEESYAETDARIREACEALRKLVTEREVFLLEKNKTQRDQQAAKVKETHLRLAEFFDVAAELQKKDLVQAGETDICQMFSRAQTCLQFADTFQLEPAAKCCFVPAELPACAIQSAFDVSLLEDFALKKQLATYEIQLRPDAVRYDTHLTRRCDDDSLRAENFARALLEQSAESKVLLRQNPRAVALFTDQTDVEINTDAALLALGSKSLQGVPHEYFGALKVHFEQVQEFYTKALLDIDQKAGKFTQIADLVQKTADTSPLGVGLIRDDAEIVFGLLNKEILAFMALFKTLAADLQTTMGGFVSKARDNYKTRVLQVFEEFAKVVAEYDSFQQRVVQMQKDVEQALQKYTEEEEKQQSSLQEDAAPREDAARRQLTISVRYAEQSYQTRLTAFTNQLELFLTFETNARAKIANLASQLEDLETQRLGFVQQYCQLWHRLVAINVSRVLEAQKTASAASLGAQASQGLLRTMYAVFCQPPSLKQIAPIAFTDFKQNMASRRSQGPSYVKARQDILPEAPSGAVGIARAMFSYDPEDDVKEECLPLKEDALYWLYEWDAQGWSVVASKEYPNIRMAAPSNYLQPVEDAVGRYRWGSAQVLRECGGTAEGVQTKPQIQETKPSQEKIVVAEFDYDHQETDELDLKEGDQIAVLETVGEWLRGRSLRTGAIGLFPANYVK